jgi:hypothetical protein
MDWKVYYFDGCRYQAFSTKKSLKFKSDEPYIVHSTDYTYAKKDDLAIKTMAKLAKNSKLKLFNYFD